MCTTKMLFTLGLVLLTAGCGPEDFLNPLYTTKDLVSDSLLAGTWEQKDDDGTLILEFQPVQGDCYTLNVASLPRDTGKRDEQGKPFYMEANACLVQLGQTRFLDFQPTEVPVEATTETFHLSLTPGSGNESSFSPVVLHTNESLFVTLALAQGGDKKDTQPEYELRITPAHWIFRIYVDQATLRLSYFEPPGDVRTLSTADLQKLVLQHADDTDFFSSGDEWQRKTGGSR
jgi:hypothetical protein